MANPMGEGSEPEKSYCFICDQLTDFSFDRNEDFDKLDKNLEMCHKFCTLVSRFLHFSCDDEFVGNFKPRNTLDFKNGSATLDLEQQICNGCFHKAEKFCDLYSVFIKVKLELNEGVNDMAGLMKNANAQTVSHNEHVGVMGFRRMFLEQVENRFDDEYPQLNLERLEMVEFTMGMEAEDDDREPEKKYIQSLEGPLESKGENQAPQEKDVEVKPELKFSCRFCVKRFKTWRNYKIHHTVVHKYLKRKRSTIAKSKIEPKFSCKTCGKGFRQSRDLKIHERIHTGERPHRCPVCDSTWNDPSNLKRHILGLHGLDRVAVEKMDIREENVENENVVSAPSTNSGSTSEPNFEVAQPSATLNNGDDNKNQSEASANQALLQKDIAMNSELKFSCRLCFKRFKTSRNYKTHYGMVHKYLKRGTITENKNKNKFSCKTCGKRFRYRLHLTVHLRIHTGEQPYRCKICDRTWTVAGNLKRHLLGFHGLDRAAVDKMGIREENVNVVSLSPSQNSGSTSEANFEVPQPTTATLNNGDDNKNQSEASVDMEHEHQAEAGREAVNHVDNAAKDDKIQESDQLHVKCRFCQKQFSTWRNCKIHQTLVHKKQARQKMPNSELSTDNPNPDENEGTSHGNQNLPFKCNLCDKRFQTLRNRKIHRTVVHKKLEKVESAINPRKKENVSIKHGTEPKKHGEEEEFVCKHCGKTFKYWTSLVFHEMENHMSAKAK